MKNKCTFTKTNICPHKKTTVDLCYDCEIPDQIRKIEEIIEETCEKIKKNKDRNKKEIYGSCPRNKNLVCRYASINDSTHCEDCIRKEFKTRDYCPKDKNIKCKYINTVYCVNCFTKSKEKEMSECEKETTKMKCFHTSKNDRFFWSKDSVTKKYDVYKKYWGGIITNKPSRTKEKYAHRISIDGSRMSSINEEDFKKIFAPICEHIYEDNCDRQKTIHLSPKELENIIKRKLTDNFCLRKIIEELTKGECEILFNDLFDNKRFREVYDVRVVGFDSIDPKKDRLIILKKK